MTSNPVKVCNGEYSINPAKFDRIRQAEDSKLPNGKKSTSSLNAFKKHFKIEGRVPVPEAIFEVQEDYVGLSPCKLPTEYVQFTPKSQEDYDKIVEYDFDDEDAHWLSLLNAELKRKKEKEIDNDSFELVMDRLEKECVFELKSHSSMVNDSMDDVCCVCCDGETTNCNQIIYCDMCNIAVHQDCYGVPYIPAGQWLCRRCKLSPSKTVECILCPSTTGAFKQTITGKWAHVTCAIWLNEVHFGNTVFLEPIEGIDDCLKKRAKLKCLVCLKRQGACLQCSTRSCVKAFHVTCAQNSGMSMQVKARKDEKQEDGIDVQRFVYCHLHTDDDEMGGDMAARKKRMDNAVKMARKNMQNKTQEINISMPTISIAALQGISKRVPFDIKQIVAYWYQKRKSRCGAPLIRRLQLQLSCRTRPTIQIELSEQDKNIMTASHKIRICWENTRLLCELVKKREAVKSTHCQILQDTAMKFVKSLQMILEEVVEKLLEKDKDKIFAQPVNVEGYRTIVKHPMDLSTMKKHIKSGKYETFADLKAAFNLMMDNCVKFNKHNEWYLNYGKRFKKSGLTIIADGEREHQEIIDVVTDPKQTASLLAMRFYESLVPSEQIEEVKEEEEEEEEEVESTPTKKETKTRKNSTSTPKTVEKKSLAAKTPKSQPIVATPVSRRRGAEVLSPPSNNKAKRPRKEDLKQQTITKFLMPRGPKETHNNNNSVYDYRDCSVISPKFPDTASSTESSTDDDNGMVRRSARSRKPIKKERLFLTSDEDNSDEIKHNDIVNINGIVGRAIISKNPMDTDIPKELLTDLRSRRQDSRICVLLFDPENKWAFYNLSELELLDNVCGDHKEVSSDSLAKARSWFEATRRLI